jgi:hypothetical protein
MRPFRVVAKLGLGVLALVQASILLAGPESAAFGKWRVVGHLEPGIAAMSPEQAQTWLGTAAVYSRSAARFGRERCTTPAYVVSHLDVGTFMEQFRLRPTDIGIHSQPVTVITIQCNGPWVAPGAIIVVSGPDRILTLWDGVFFELQRK